MLETEMVQKNRGQLSFDELLDFNVLSSYGIDSGGNMQAFVEEIVNFKLKRTHVTFMELAKITGKNLVICVANLTKQKEEYMDVDSQPSLDVVKAIRMSISLPFIFTPVIYNGNTYVDGALYETLPIGYISRFKDPLKDTIAIHTRTTVDSKIESFSDYISLLFSSIVVKANSNTNHNSTKVNIMEVVFDDNATMPLDVQTLKFDIDKTIIQTSINKGYIAIKKRFEARTSSMNRVSAHS
jgi:predicted acylesterase/phospholipase RssA